jgi:DNA methyltransferase 1-associated protein 1
LDLFSSQWQLILSQARCLALEHGGESGMNETEFALYETLTKYKPEVEIQRKELGWRLFERPLEEIREEEYLLAELQRIMISAQNYEAERAEVRQRLEHPLGRGGSVPSSFAELNALYNQLFAQDRNRRARGRLSINANDLAQSPAGAMGLNGTPASGTHHRDSLVSASLQKKGSLSSAHPVRTLDPRTEKKYGITSHDRLTSGVTFRSDKLLKLRQAKSQIQTQKIAAALVELGVPDLLQLPTQRVLDTFEALVQKVQRLVDARKVLEKEEAEARVQGGLRKELQKDKDGEEGGDMEPQTEEPTQIDEEEEEEEDDMKDADAEDEKDASGEDEDADGEEDDNDGEDESQFEGHEVEEDEDAEGSPEEDDERDAEGEEMEVD